MDYKTDYLVIGGGAQAMAFVDTMLKETDATFLIVDRRPKVGGHWNDAYPFVRLHQPSSYYGVASRPLGRHRLDEAGSNKGFFELATGVEITHYYHALMDEVFTPSKRVQHLPLCDYTDEGRIISLMSGEEHKVVVNKKIVNATHMTTEIPMTHTPKFKVAEGVSCVPPNHLCQLAPEYKHITVLGGGKTGIDSVTWLLDNDYLVDNITWVIPRDSWFFNRSKFQPDESFLEETLEGIAGRNEYCATAETVDDLCLGMESTGVWLRLDQDIWPTMFHAAVITKADLKQLQGISNIVRLGRVELIEPEKMVLAKGEIKCHPETLYVDCTASAAASNVHNMTPVFQTGLINLNMIRNFQPCFSAALIAHLEAKIEDDALRQAMARPAPMTDTVEDYLTSQAHTLMNEAQWMAHEEIANWMIECRLDGFSHLIANINSHDHKKISQLERIRQNGQSAVENLLRLAAVS